MSHRAAVGRTKTALSRTHELRLPIIYLLFLKHVPAELRLRLHKGQYHCFFCLHCWMFENSPSKEISYSLSKACPIIAFKTIDHSNSVGCLEQELEWTTMCIQERCSCTRTSTCDPTWQHLAAALAQFLDITTQRSLNVHQTWLRAFSELGLKAAARFVSQHVHYKNQSACQADALLVSYPTHFVRICRHLVVISRSCRPESEHARSAPTNLGGTKHVFLRTFKRASTEHIQFNVRFYNCSFPIAFFTINAMGCAFPCRLAIKRRYCCACGSIQSGKLMKFSVAWHWD